MLATQLERLRKDARALQHRERRLNKEGRYEEANQIRMKREYLSDSIGDMEDQYYI